MIWFIIYIRFNLYITLLFQQLFFTKLSKKTSYHFHRSLIDWPTKIDQLSSRMNQYHPSKEKILELEKRKERKKEVEIKSSLNRRSIVRRPRNWSSRVCGHVPFPSPVPSCSRIIDHREPWLSAVKYNFLESLEMVGEAGVGETRFRLEGPR